MAKEKMVVGKQQIMVGGRQYRRLKRKCAKPQRVLVAQKQKAPNPLFYLILVAMLLCNAVCMPTDELVFIGSVVICGIALYCKHADR